MIMVDCFMIIKIIVHYIVQYDIISCRNMSHVFLGWRTPCLYPGISVLALVLDTPDHHFRI